MVETIAVGVVEMVKVVEDVGVVELVEGGTGWNDDMET
jgi:hypothetical protein